MKRVAVVTSPAKNRSCVSDCANAAVVWALEEQSSYFSELYEKRLASEFSERWPAGDGADSDEKFDSATVLFVDIPQYGALAEQLSSTELTEGGEPTATVY